MGTSKLPVDILKNIWTMADNNPQTNFLDRKKFFVAVRLIQMFQNGKKAQGPTLQVVDGSSMRPPYFEGVTGVSVQPFSIELGSQKPQALLIDKGYAHGFLTIEDQSWVQYLTSSVHDPDRDLGVHWTSIDCEWPVKSPVISKRDSSLPPITL